MAQDKRSARIVQSHVKLPTFQRPAPNFASQTNENLSLCYKQNKNYFFQEMTGYTKPRTEKTHHTSICFNAQGIHVRQVSFCLRFYVQELCMSHTCIDKNTFQSQYKLNTKHRKFIISKRNARISRTTFLARPHFFCWQRFPPEDF